MKSLSEKIVEKFGDKLRVRVCGLLIENDSILLANHHSLTDGGDFWSPPGGGMDFGQSAKENLKREFREETGLEIEVEKFLFVHEYLSPPLHAIELIFKVSKIGGKLITGHDPELGDSHQIIKDVRFIPFSELKKIDKHHLHQMFLRIKTAGDIGKDSGYFLWKNDEISMDSKY